MTWMPGALADSRPPVHLHPAIVDQFQLGIGGDVASALGWNDIEHIAVHLFEFEKGHAAYHVDSLHFARCRWLATARRRDQVTTTSRQEHGTAKQRSPFRASIVAVATRCAVRRQR